MRKYVNQRGFTLVEILVVIAIIAILFVVLIPQIDKAVQKSRVHSVRSDFRAYQQMTHSFLLNTRGKNATIEKYNSYLDQKLRFGLQDEKSSVTDSWGNPYVLRDLGEKVVIVSGGVDETIGTKDDLLLAMYANRDYVDVCTIGFEPNDLALKSIPLVSGGDCGANPAMP